MSRSVDSIDVGLEKAGMVHCLHKEKVVALARTARIKSAVSHTFRRYHIHRNFHRGTTLKGSSSCSDLACAGLSEVPNAAGFVF